jgi:iron complex outermembrane recepter protein
VVTGRDNNHDGGPARLRGWARHAHVAAGLAIAAALPIAAGGARAETALPDINVIAPSPLPAHRPAPRQTAPRRQTNAAPAPAAPAQPAPAEPAPAPAATGAIDRDKVPANTQVLTAAEFDHAQSSTMLDALVRALPGVSVTDQTGNPFQRDLNYRGFTASPVIGTPQGLAIYQNGVRINEVFGDTVNWDFIPDVAVHRMSLVPNNPVYGLNALGGAVSIEMKNGFTYQGKEFEVLGGSYGRIQGTAQAGFQDGGIAAYASADAINDKGWRQFASSSHLNRLYFDIGTRGDQGEFHLAFTGANNQLSGTVATPVEMLNRQWSSVYTWPQTTQNQLAFVTANASYSPTETLTLAGNAYFRGYWQHHVDGNNTEAQFCAPAPPLLCFGDGTTPLNGAGGLNIPTTATLGEVDRTLTAAASYGGSLQATSTSKVLDRPNNIVVGMSIDHGQVQFNAASELGTIDQNLFVTGTGVIINQPAGDLAPVSLLSTTTYTGLYATDTFELTPRLAVTAGGRFNVAQIDLADQLGGALSSDNRYQRFNPVVGATFKITPNATAYAGYSEANRAPTPLELGCADPVRPCLIDNFLISDPPLKQVVSHTVEAGLRGNIEVGPAGQLRWNAGVFHTQNTDDIINVASTIVLGQGYFLNAGKTLRQGVETGVSYRSSPWNVYANYTFVDATFQSPLTLSSPNNPAADPNGNIFVTPGDHIPAAPQHRFKAGIEYAVTDAWKIGADLNAVGSQYLIGDQSNQNPKVPPYAVVNLHGSYQVTKNLEAFALVQNLFNQHYYTTGTFFSTASVPFLGLTDPRMFVPGMPLAAYAGMRARF